MTCRIAAEPLNPGARPVRPVVHQQHIGPGWRSRSSRRKVVLLQPSLRPLRVPDDPAEAGDLEPVDLDPLLVQVVQPLLEIAAQRPIRGARTCRGCRPHRATHGKQSPKACHTPGRRPTRRGGPVPAPRRNRRRAGRRLRRPTASPQRGKMSCNSIAGSPCAQQAGRCAVRSLEPLPPLQIAGDHRFALTPLGSRSATARCTGHPIFVALPRPASCVQERNLGDRLGDT